MILISRLISEVITRRSRIIDEVAITTLHCHARLTYNRARCSDRVGQGRLSNPPFSIIDSNRDGVTPFTGVLVRHCELLTLISFTVSKVPLDQRGGDICRDVIDIQDKASYFSELILSR